MVQKSTFQKGRIPWNKGLNGWNKGHNVSLETRMKISKANTKLNPKSTINELIRKSPKYKNWRNYVFTRDNFKCIKCGGNKDIHPHHIKEFSKYPELRFEVSNGQTLCAKCHGEIHGLNFNKLGRYLTCLMCKTKFRPKSGNLHQECCSKICGYKLRTQRGSKKKGRHYPHLQRKPIKICQVCNNEFRAIEHKTRKQKYCSRNCWNTRKENLTGKKAIKLNS
jgi:hypothetical protein